MCAGVKEKKFRICIWTEEKKSISSYECFFALFAFYGQLLIFSFSFFSLLACKGCHLLKDL